MAEAVVSFVIEQLGGLIVQEAKFLSGVRDQVQRAQTDLQFIKGFLKDADVKQRDNETIRIFVVQTRDAAYDLEDVIETFVLKVASKRKGGIKNVLKRFGCIFVEGVRLHEIGSEIGVITTTISDLKRNLQSYDILRDLRDSGGASSIQSQDQKQQQLRRTYSHVPEINVVGLEGGVHELVGRLVKEEHCHRVVSICGMGGSGKSTLAKEVYHHNDVKQHFDCFAWVCISQQYQVRDVLERIYVKLISATKEEREEIARLKDDEIPGRLSAVQNERKCLIVLDDIWKVETWDLLKAAFQHGEKSKSRILLTTRNKKVALHADVNGFCYETPPFNETESWQLLEKITMCGRHHDAIEKEIQSKEELGRKMLSHCAGLPLAITVLAGLLARKNTLSEWNTIHENVSVYVSRGIDRHDEDHASTSWVLALSYDDLPYHLKPCFLYLGHFPEDYEIRVKILVRLWIAEGFISLTQQNQDLGETMEDVAHNWLNELIERCMIQIGKRSSIPGKIKTCRMHDLLRDLCLVKAKEENFLQVVKWSDKNEPLHPFSSSKATNTSPMGKIRRLAIYLNENDEKLVPSRDERGGHLRSVLYFGPSDDFWFPKRRELIPSMFRDFKLLRVLRIEGMDGGSGVDIELPSEIGNMVHLKYLSLRNSGVKLFPPFLGNLVCLQTLDFFVSYDYNNVVIVPDVIWKMTRLKHLYLPWNYKARGILKLSTLADLQTLCHFSSEYCDLSDLNKLGSLTKLKIRLSWNINHEKVWEAGGSALNRIRSLFLDNSECGVEGGKVVSQILARCGQMYKLKMWGPVVLPEELPSYPNLTKLFLDGSALKEDQMAILEELPNLKSLELRFGVFEENMKVMVFSEGSFPSLQFLSLFYLFRITEWRVEEGALPNLCRLFIIGCEGLTMIPDGLRHLTNLKELKIGRMPNLFCSKLEEGGEDFHKVQHIPSLIILNPEN